MCHFPQREENFIILNIHTDSLFHLKLNYNKVNYLFVIYLLIILVRIKTLTFSMRASQIKILFSILYPCFIHVQEKIKVFLFHLTFSLSLRMHEHKDYHERNKL